MPVSRISLLVVLHPLLQSPAFPDFHGRQFPHALCYTAGKAVTYMQAGGGIQAPPEQPSYDLRIHSRRHTQASHLAVLCYISVFRRQRRATEQLPMLILLQVIQEEFCCLLHHRICLFPEEILVTAVEIMFPQVITEPRSPHGPEARTRMVIRCRVTPQICIVMNDKAPAPIHPLCCLTPVYPCLFYESEQRQLTVPQTARFGRPIIHLGIDIYSIFAVPLRNKAIAPDSLKICRLRSRTAAGYQKITPDVKISLYHSIVSFSLPNPLQAFIRGQ